MQPDLNVVRVQRRFAATSFLIASGAWCQYKYLCAGESNDNKIIGRSFLCNCVLSYWVLYGCTGTNNWT